MSPFRLWGTGDSASSSPNQQCLNNRPHIGDPTQVDQRRIESGYYAPEDENETLRQFLLDAPRMDVNINGRQWNRMDAPSALAEFIFSMFPRKSAVLAAQFCTQTALAPFFCSVKDEFGKEKLTQETHFVDGGRQSVWLDSRQLLMEVEKPFKVVDFDDHMNARVLFIVTLILYVNLQDGHVQHRFTRSSLVEKDWVYVEDLSLEDEDVLESGGGAEDIAASAMRMRLAN